MNFNDQRHKMVSKQLIERGIEDPKVLTAMNNIPREKFVDTENQERAYDDNPLPITEGQTISQPYIVALMIEELELGAEDRVLEVGAGCGYASAVLGQIANKVYGIEWHQALANQAQERIKELDYHNIQIHQGDGWIGLPEYAPYDAILISAACEKIPTSLKQQLKVGGRLIAPVALSNQRQQLIKLKRLSQNKFSEEKICDVSFVPFLGKEP